MNIIQLFKKIFFFLAKIILCTFIIVLIVLFGVNFGPDKEEATVDAKIFDRLIYYTQSMPDYLFNEKTGSKARKTVFNGNNVYFKVGKTKDSIQSVLNFYEKKYQTPNLLQIDPELLQKIYQTSDKKVVENVKIVVNFIEKLKPHFRVQRKNWGIWGRIELRNSELSMMSKEYIDEWTTAFEKGTIGQIGVGRITIAMQKPGTWETRFLNFWTDKDLNLNLFTPNSSGDYGGKDISDVPRPPKSHRLFCIDQYNVETLDSFLIYKGHGEQSQFFAFYDDTMTDNGWTKDELFQNNMNTNKDTMSYFFTKNNKECMISINKSDQMNEVITTILHRKTEEG